MSDPAPALRRGFIERPDARLYFEVCGSGPVLVFAHGLGGNHLSWWQQVPAFSDRFTCVTFAHRGFTPSSCATNPPDPADYPGDLAALLDHLGIERAHLVGQSMGGWTVIGFALAHPGRVRSLALSATTGPIDVEAGGRIAAIEAWRARVPAEVAALVATGGHPATGARMAREQPALHHLYHGIGALSGGLDRDALRARLWAARSLPPARLAALSLPVQCMAGTEDVVICPQAVEALAAALPGAVFERFEGAGHSPYFERAVEFNARLAAFLEKAG